MGPGQATCLAVIILAGLGLFCTSAGLFWFTGGDVPFDYGITIDAGSSKTAFFLYDWSAAKTNETGLVRQLSVEYVHEGIDDFGGETKDLIPKLINALSRITRKIDYTSKNYVIPIYLGATAGMRILRIENGLGASKILRDIKQSFDLFADSENDFKVKNVEIISGTKEGLYCWIATNYLMDFLPEEQSKINGTVGTLDMGGASAQIAFQVGPARVLASKDNASEVSSASEPLTGMNESSAPSATATIMSEITTTDGESGGLIDASGGTGAAADAETTEQRAEHKVKERTQLFGREYRVSTFSNLCFGNDDARKRFQMLLILQHPESRIVHDPCTHPRQLERIIDSEELSKNVCTYDPNGERRQLPHPEYKFIAQPHVNRCAQLTRQLVSVESVRQNFKDHDFQVLEQPPPKDMRFFAMATFYFAAKQLRNREIVSFQSEDEMAAAVSDYCQRTWDDVVLYRTTKEMHYVKNFCFSVNYVFNYLKHVYRFRKEQFAQIEFRGQLGGHSLGWALGYMLQETNRIPGSGPKPPIINGLWFTILILFSAALLLFAAGSVVKKHISNKGEYMATQVSPMNKQSRV